MKIKVLYSKKARKDLKKLDIKIAQRIALKIKYYSLQDDPLKHASFLKPPWDDLYKFRIGEYRAIFESDSKGNLLLLTIMKIGHRKNVYK